MAPNSAKSPEWRSSGELDEELRHRADRSELGMAATISFFLRRALPIRHFVAPTLFAEAIVPSEHGLDAIALSGYEAVERGEQPALMLALLAIFAHHEPLIDVARCDLNAIENEVSKLIRERHLLLPHRFGRLLYDKFNDTSPDERRFIPPSLNPNLWHCSDPGCGALHDVELLPIPEVAFVSYKQSIGRLLHERLGPASDWFWALRSELGRVLPEKPYSYRDVTALLSDCIVGTEREALFCAALESEKGSVLRQILSSPPRRKNAGNGAPQQIVKNLAEEERLQLLWVFHDTVLVSLIDSCISRSVFQVPPTELRASKNIYGSTNEHVSEMSSLGLRCPGNDALVDFFSLVWDAYSVANRTADLDWLLRNVGGLATKNALLAYMCQNNPPAVVRELVLSSEVITKTICERIRCAVDNIADPKFVDRMLWKIGFNLPRYDDLIPTLRRRLDAFNQELVAVGTLREERDRERIRSAGVNLFVSIEQFLEAFIAYKVWFFASDHFIKTKCTYEPDEAMNSVMDVIGASISPGDVVQFQWKGRGENTLGSLLAYLHATAAWIKSLLSSDRDLLLRPKRDLPHFADDQFREFAFTHIALWADSDYGAMSRLADTFQTLCNKVARANLAFVRNGLDHQRDEQTFPKVDEMLAFVAHFREALDSADVQRFFPKEFWLEHVESDRYNRTTLHLKDYYGRHQILSGPTFIHKVGPRVGSQHPVLVGPGNILGYTNAEILFRIREPSVYTDYWKNYPRRREIPNPHIAVQDAVVSDQVAA